MTDSTSLTSCTTTTNVYKNVEFVSGLSCCQRLTNDQFQGLKTKILIDISLVDGTLPVPGTKYTLAMDFFLLPVP